jgi:hypothetical protein
MLRVVDHDEPDLATEMIRMQRQLDEIQVRLSLVSAKFARTRQWFEEGFNTPIDWIRFNCHVTEKVAGDRIAVGNKQAEISVSVQAMQSGEIGFATWPSWR